MMWHVILFGYVVGVAVGLFAQAPLLTGVCFVLGLSILTVWYREKMVRSIAVALILISVGYWQSHRVYESWQTLPIEHTVSGRATIIRPPDIKERTQEVTLQFTKCLDGNCPKRFVLGYFPVYSALGYGDSMFVECPLKIPKNTGLDFDYRMYLAMKKY